MSESLLSVSGLKRKYKSGDGWFEALKGVSFNIDKGESVAIVGKSGSGKSTLMHLISLLDKPNAGNIVLDGQDTTLLTSKELDVLRNKHFGFIFQQFFLNSNQSVLDNVTLPLKIAGMPVKERKERGMEVLRKLELEDKYKNRANDLSGGQKQRVVIARALINKPSIIFADEPTGNLDSATSLIVENMLLNLNKETGITLIVVTHDNDLAQKLDRQIQVADGLIIGDSKTKEVQQ